VERNPTRWDQLWAEPSTRRIAEGALANALGTLLALAVAGLAARGIGLLPGLPTGAIALFVAVVVLGAVLLVIVLTKREPTEAEIAARLAALGARVQVMTARHHPPAPTDEPSP
jgi:membrane protein implicated in regulation of membrane protease activity